MRVERLCERYRLDVVWTHFPLHPETPAEGRDLEDLFAGRLETLTAMKTELQRQFDAEGLPWGERARTYNSRLAQELGVWAETRPDGGRIPRRGTTGRIPRRGTTGNIHDALFRAYFVDGENLAREDVLVRIAGELGLDAAEASAVLRERRFEREVDRHWARSRAFGITGVPTFVAGERGVVGAQSEEVLERLVVDAGAQRIA